MDPPTSAHRRRPELWLRVAGLTLLGGVLILIISIPGLASEDQSTSPGIAGFAAAALVFVGVAARVYVVLRRAAVPPRRALLVALAALPTAFAIALLLVWGIVSAA